MEVFPIGYRESLYTRLNSWSRDEIRKIGYEFEPQITAVNKETLLQKFRDKGVCYEDLSIAALIQLCKSAGMEYSGAAPQEEAVAYLIDFLKRQDRDNARLARGPMLTPSKKIRLPAQAAAAVADDESCSNYHYARLCHTGASLMRGDDYPSHSDYIICMNVGNEGRRPTASDEQIGRSIQAIIARLGMGNPGILLLQEYSKQSKSYERNLDVILNEAGLPTDNAKWKNCRIKSRSAAGMSGSIIIFDSNIYKKGHLTSPLEEFDAFYEKKRFSTAKLIVKKNRNLQFLATSMHGFHINLPSFRSARQFFNSFQFSREELCKMFIKKATRLCVIEDQEFSSVNGVGVPALIAGDWNHVLTDETVEGIRAYAGDRSEWKPRTILPGYSFENEKGQRCVRLGKKLLDSVCYIAPPEESSGAPFLSIDNVNAVPHHSSYRRYYDHDAIIIEFTLSDSHIPLEKTPSAAIDSHLPNPIQDLQSFVETKMTTIKELSERISNSEKALKGAKKESVRATVVNDLSEQARELLEIAEDILKAGGETPNRFNELSVREE